MIVFAIIGKGDFPLYQCEFRKPGESMDSSRTDQFLLYSSLDCVEEVVWQSTNPFLKAVDVSERASIYAYVTPGHTRFLLYFEEPTQKDEATAEAFFKEVHEVYLRVCFIIILVFIYFFFFILYFFTK